MRRFKVGDIIASKNTMKPVFYLLVTRIYRDPMGSSKCNVIYISGPSKNIPPPATWDLITTEELYRVVA